MTFKTLLAIVMLLTSALAQVQGTIAGTVVDETGKPVAGAKVHIAQKDVLVVHQIVQYHETDDGGHFRIPHVPWGTYVVVAGKESAGYPAPVFAAFYSSYTLPNVTLREDFPSADIVVRIGPKAGILDIEPVADQATGKEIRSASVTLRRAEDPHLFLSASTTQRRVFVPAFTEVLIEITAEGYKPWPPPDQAATEGKILLKPEQVQKLRVTLQPADPVPAAGQCGPIDRNSAEAVSQEVNRVFNEALDKMEHTLPSGTKAITWIPSDESVRQQIGCLGVLAVPATSELLRNTNRSFGHVLAIRMLGWIGGPEIVPPLAVVLSNPGDSVMLKIEALQSLVAAPPEKALPTVQQVLRTEKNRHVLEKAASVAAELEAPARD